MTHITVYRLINKQSNVFKQYRNPAELCSFLLGRNNSNYIILKSDESGDRVVKYTPTDEKFCILEFESQLKVA